MIIAPSSTIHKAQFDVEKEHLYTAADLLSISADTSHRLELRKGKLTTMSPAGSKHGLLAMRLGAQIQLFSDERRIGITFAAETGFLLEENPDTVLAPDVAFVGKEQLSGDGLPGGYFPGTPELAVEVVSPNDRVSRVQDKVQMWLHYGTKLVWIVEPKTKTVTVYRADGSVTLLQASDILDGENVLPGFRYDLKKLFA